MYQQLISTPHKIVVEFMDLISVGPYDVFYDLGCGDGRLVIEAAKRGALGVCIEMDRILCNIVEIYSKMAGVKDRIKVICSNMFDIDLSSAYPSPTIVYVYHYPSTIKALSSKLAKELSPGTVIASLDTPFTGWSPIAILPMVDEIGSLWFLWIYLKDYG